MKWRGSKGGILLDDGVETLGERGARLGQALPAVGRRGRLGGRSQRGLVDHLARHGYDVLVRGTPSALRAAVRSNGGRSLPVRCPNTLRSLRKMKTASARKMMV